MEKSAQFKNERKDTSGLKIIHITEHCMELPKQNPQIEVKKFFMKKESRSHIDIISPYKDISQLAAPVNNGLILNRNPNISKFV
jgi:hypothetical protein